jgi:hypothetical protein
MADLRLVRPVTTASGNVAGTAGVAVAAGADAGCEATDVGETSPDEGGVGLAVTHPARSTPVTATAAHRKIIRFSMALS